MPLSPPAAREIMHTRAITLEGYQRADGLLDIEAHLVDTKPFSFGNVDRGTIAPGEPLHEMRVRVTIDQQLTIVHSEAVTEHGPFFTCAGGAASMGDLVGLAIRPGFLKAANARLGGVRGCTHLRELLQQIGTVALQTLWPVRSRREAAAQERARQHGTLAADATAREDGSARLVDTCHAYDRRGPVVRRRWSHLYRGDGTAAPAPAEAGQASPAAPVAGQPAEPPAATAAGPAPSPSARWAAARK